MKRITREEAAGLLGRPRLMRDELPAAAAALRERGLAEALLITGGRERLALDWLDTPHARGWLASPRRGGALALPEGFVAADAAVLARFAADDAFPWLSFGEAPVFHETPPPPAPPLGLYAIVDSAERVRAVLAAGIRTIQLRIKDTPPRLAAEIAEAAQACRAAGARLFVNDHWQLASACGAHGTHLGQEDLLAMSERERGELKLSGLALGISSHSPWELARARSLAPAYIACGPVWSTLTKAMPWRPQGLDNLRWWCAVAGVPVVAIGGILTTEQISAAAGCGADGVCVVRMLGDEPAVTVPAIQQALGRTFAPTTCRIHARPGAALPIIRATLG
ncbi:thiamine phosphate synthase [Pelomonas sp. KK5]|uniref:thiamine phosphate synthase n=1 Tax=Pelomonas sp. KK5 TaxID=1855730 RepID=UPI00097CB835|nr:thiamine phosphate synthase [Pelomonas sp. KK5]